MKNKTSRSGFTLIELLLGVLISGIIMVISFQVLVSERRSAEARRQEMNAQQNLRVALDKLSNDIRMAGFTVDEFNGQPRMIDAGPWQIAFNGNISVGVGGDVAMPASQQIKLTGGSTYSPGDYPAENLGGMSRYNGGAETVVLGLDANFDGLIDDDDEYDDSQNPADFSIYRSVNGERSDRLAYGIRGPSAYPDGTLPNPLFQYWGNFGGTFGLWGDSNDDGFLNQGEIAALTPVSISEMPNILYVDLELASFTEGEVASMGHEHGTEDDPFNYLEINATSRIRPRNFGVNPANLSACGDPPTKPYGLWVQDTPDDAGSSISVHFNASYDESYGEEDVTHYFVYRREVGGAFTVPLAKVPAANLGTYTFHNDLHTQNEEDIPVDGTQYYYAVTSWDCKPQESNLSSQAGPVTSQPNGSAPPVLISVYDTPCDDGEEITVLFEPSPDETAGIVDGYRIYRGPTSGDFLAKTLIGYVNATGGGNYTFLDNLDNNVAGAPPQNDSEYYFTVRAVSDTIVSVDSNELGPVSADVGLSAALLDNVSDVPFDYGNSLQISWLRSESETCVPNPVLGYQLQRQGPVDNDFLDLQYLATTGDPNYSVQDSSLLAGQPYTYRVVTKSIDDAEPSNELEGIPTNNNDLMPPTNLTAEGIPCDASGAIVLEWQKSFHDNASGDVESYRIWRRTQGAGGYSQVGLEIALGYDNYAWTDDDSGANPPVIGLTYEYVVTAYNGTNGNESSYSNMATCTSSSIPAAPYLASVYDTPDDNGNSITVVFIRSEDDGNCSNSVVSYSVYRTESWGNYDLTSYVGDVTATGAWSYTFHDAGFYADAPTNETPYYYMVRAYDGVQQSVDSNQRGPVMAIEDAMVNTTLLYDGFEAEMGWLHGGNEDDWQRGDPQANSQTYGESDPENADLGTRVFGTDIGASGWNGQYRAYADSWLMSPQIDCSAAIDVSLTFARWLNVEQPIYDRAIIEVSGNGEGGPWSKIWENPTEITDTSWHDIGFDISYWADGRADVRVRFRLESDSSWHYAGWNIDEFYVTGNQ